MDAKLRSTWTSKAAQAAFSPAAPVQVSAIAALPVLPASFSSASAEPSRAVEAASSGLEVAGAAMPWHSKPGFLSDILPHAQYEAPLSLTDPGNAAVAPVRVNDLSQKPPGDGDAPACRPGEMAGADGSDTAGPAPPPDERVEERGQAGQPAPLPNCAIEFDPDSVEPDIVAHTPLAPAAKGPAKVAQVAAPAAATAHPAADKGAGQIASEVAPHPADAVAQASQAVADHAAPGSSAAGAAASGLATSGLATPGLATPGLTASGSAASGLASPSLTTSGLTTSSLASDTPLAVTNATVGVGAQMIDPLLPIDSVLFASDLTLLFPAAPPAPAPDLALPAAVDPVGDALAATAAGASPAPALLSDYLLLS